MISCLNLVVNSQPLSYVIHQSHFAQLIILFSLIRCFHLTSKILHSSSYTSFSLLSPSLSPFCFLLILISILVLSQGSVCESLLLSMWYSQASITAYMLIIS